MCLILAFKIGISGAKPLSVSWVIFEIGNLEIQVKPNYVLGDSTLQSVVSACVLNPIV